MSFSVLFPQLKEVMKNIRQYMDVERKQGQLESLFLYHVIQLSAAFLLFLPFTDSVLGPIEADPEYQVIVDSNNLIVEVDNEISESRLIIIQFSDVRGVPMTLQMSSTSLLGIFTLNGFPSWSL